MMLNYQFLLDHHVLFHNIKGLLGVVWREEASGISRYYYHVALVTSTDVYCCFFNIPIVYINKGYKELFRVGQCVRVGVLTPPIGVHMIVKWRVL